MRHRRCWLSEQKFYTNKLGFIGGFKIPNVMDTINAFTLGARSVNPKAEMHVIFDNTWSDPGKEAASTNALADQGVDVITMIVDSPITIVQTAEQRGIYSVGFHSTSVQKYAPKGWISGIGFTWAGFLTRGLQLHAAGAGRRPLLVVLDCKGGADARRIADRVRRVLRVAGRV